MALALVGAAFGSGSKGTSPSNSPSTSAVRGLSVDYSNLAATLNPDMTYDPLNASGDAAYPIATPTWVIAYKQTDKAKGDALKGFLNFVLTDGQSLANDANYAALPDAYRQKAIGQLNAVTVG